MRATRRCLSLIRGKYGIYPVLEPGKAWYPPVRYVPKSIPRPEYVPSNFFDVGWGHHATVAELRVPTQEEGRLASEDVAGVRKASKLAAEVLQAAGKLVKVCS